MDLKELEEKSGLSQKVVYDTIKDYFERELGEDTSDFSGKSRLGADLGLDSLEAIDLSIELEKKFSIDQVNADMNENVTVDELIEKVLLAAAK